MKRHLWLWLLFAGSLARAAMPLDVAVEGRQPNDPLILQGDYNAPVSSGAPVLVLLHGLGSTREEWAPLVAAATRRGWGTLAYDLRGHGRSRGTISGETLRYDDPQNTRRASFWKQFPTDLEQVVLALEKKKIVREQIVLVGASLGANICLETSTRLEGWRGLVLLSPGLDYAGLTTEGPMAALQTPTLLIAAAPDRYAYGSSERLKTLAPAGRVTWKPLAAGTSRGAHGTQLFDGSLENQILDWMGDPHRR